MSHPNWRNDIPAIRRGRTRVSHGGMYWGPQVPRVDTWVDSARRIIYGCCIGIGVLALIVWMASR